MKALKLNISAKALTVVPPSLRVSAIVCLATAGLAAPPATAQSAREDAGALALEEIIVTASRRTERLQDVAMSVSAFNSEFFADSGINELTGLEQYTPNLKITQGTDSRSVSIRIRGIGSLGTNSGIDPSVGLFLDGVYQGRAGMSISDLVDTERVEVLRGPQGTLYGKNTAAGAISIITKLPSPEFESMVELGYDSNELGELRGMVNFPLGDTAHAMRLSGWVVKGDHLYDNSFTGEGVNNADKWGGRARMLFDLTEDNDAGLGQFVFSVDYTEEDTECCAFAIIDYNGLSTLNAPSTNNPSAALQERLGLNAQGQPILRYNAFEDSEGFSPPQSDPFGDDYWYDAEVYNKVKVGGVALEWNRDFGPGEITFLNAWRHYESDSVFDGDFTAYEASTTTTEVELDQFSSELRFTSEVGEKLDYQGGLYYYYSEFDSIGTFTQLEPLVNNVLVIGDLTLGTFFPDGTLNTDTNVYKTTSYAAFGQATWNFSEQLSLTLGLRYTNETKERKGSQITEPTSFIDIPPVAGPDIYSDDERTDTDVSPTINLRYFFEDDLMVYATASRGFKSGGYNQRREVVGSNGEFDEEIATNYELGWKTSWFNQRLRFNGTFFHVSYDDFQSQTFTGATLKVTNAGNLESYGTELELVFIPMADMTIGSAIGYNKAEYESFDGGQCTVAQAFEDYYITQGAQGGSPGTNSQCVQDLAGKPLDNAPEWTVSSYLQYNTEFGDNLAGVVRLEHSYIDEYYLDQDLDENLTNDAVNLINLRFTLSNIERDWEVALWGRNMLDEEYYSLGYDIPTMGGFAGIVAPQASYGVTLRWYR
jgi:iron complex outermembrane recepter protein